MRTVVDYPVTRAHAFQTQAPRTNIEDRLARWWKAGYFEGTAVADRDPLVLASWVLNHGIPLGLDRRSLARLLASLPPRRQPSWPIILASAEHVATAEKALELASMGYAWPQPGFNFGEYAEMKFAVCALSSIRRGQYECALKWAIELMVATRRVSP